MKEKIKFTFALIFLRQNQLCIENLAIASFKIMLIHPGFDNILSIITYDKRPMSLTDQQYRLL